MLLNNQQVTEEVKEEILKRPKKKKWQRKHDDPKPMGSSKGSPTGKPRAVQLHPEKQEHQTDNVTSHRKQREKSRRAQSCQKETNHKDQSRKKRKRNGGSNSKDQQN